MDYFIAFRALPDELRDDIEQAIRKYISSLGEEVGQMEDQLLEDPDWHDGPLAINGYRERINNLGVFLYKISKRTEEIEEIFKLHESPS